MNLFGKFVLMVSFFLGYQAQACGPSGDVMIAEEEKCVLATAVERKLPEGCKVNQVALMDVQSRCGSLDGYEIKVSCGEKNYDGWTSADEVSCRVGDVTLKLL